MSKGKKISDWLAEQTNVTVQQIITTGENPMIFNDTVYDDLLVTLSNVRLPASSAPTYKTWDYGAGVSGLTALSFDVGEYVEFDIQTKHANKLLQALEQHIHFGTSTDGTGKKIKFQVTGVGAGIGDAFTDIGTIASEKDLTSDNYEKHSYMELGELPDTINTTVSSVFHLKLQRVASSADEYTAGDVFVIFADLHAQNDRIGSKDEDSQ